MKTQRARVPLFLFADYLLRSVEKPSRLFVLMHGYEQSAERLFSKLEATLPADALILAPNGPFPIPRRGESGYQVGFSWYFYDGGQDEYYMDMEIGVRFVIGLIQKLGLEGLPTTLIGFSQGGYIAPFVAQELPQVDRVIGIACEFLFDELRLPVTFRLDAIHGALDEVVSPESARKSHDKLRNSGASGQFQLLPSTGHRIDEAVMKALAGLSHWR